VEEKYFINCDGGARGNPGPAAAAFVVKKGGKIIFKSNNFLGKATNNIAEYEAAIAALRWIKDNKKIIDNSRVALLLDSELITNQLLGNFKTKNPTLKKLLESAKLLEQNSKIRISYKLIPREKNYEADFLVNEILNRNQSFT